MKLKVLMTVLFITMCLPALSSYTLSDGVKEFFKKKYPNVEFKIDNSFTVGDVIYLPLIPEKITEQKKIEIVTLVHDKNQEDFPRLIQLSNKLIFVKLLNVNDEKSTILDIELLPEAIKNDLLKTKFPSDLVVPKDFFLNKELASLKKDLNIDERVSAPIVEAMELQTESIKKDEPVVISKTTTYKLPEGLLYFTSPDSGKIAFFDLADDSMIGFIQTQGIPWAITPYKGGILLVSDFSKNLIYKIEFGKSEILDSINLSDISNLADIEVSEDCSLIYALDSISSQFIVYKADDLKTIVKTKLPVNPTRFLVLRELNYIVVLSPNANSITFLNSNDFSIVNKIKIESNPEAAVFNSKNRMLYVAKRTGKALSVINISTFKEVASIEVDDTPIALAVNSSGKTLYVASGKTNTINVIDTETNKVIDTILLSPETEFPGDIKIVNDDRTLIVTSETTNTVSIFDLATQEVIKKIDLGITTHETIFQPRGVN